MWSHGVVEYTLHFKAASQNVTELYVTFKCNKMFREHKCLSIPLSKAATGFRTQMTEQ